MRMCVCSLIDLYRCMYVHVGALLSLIPSLHSFTLWPHISHGAEKPEHLVRSAVIALSHLFREKKSFSPGSGDSATPPVYILLSS